MSQQLREKTRIFVYDRQQAVLKTLRSLNFFMALVSIGLLVYFNGFPQTAESRGLIFGTIKVIFAYFIFVYAMRGLFSINRLQFLKETWMEGSMMALLVADGICLYVFKYPVLEKFLLYLGIEHVGPVYMLFVQLYILVIAGLEILNANLKMGRLKINPSLSLMLSLLFLTLIGTLLLMMPEMTTMPGTMPFQEALFTSVSAVSHTGLTVVNVGSYFTVKGHFVILLLIQIGALGIVFFGTFFGTYLARGLSLKQKHSVYEFFETESDFTIEELIRQIIFYTIFIDLLGAIVLFFLWDPSIPFNGLGDKIFCSVFHSISAFCNAGFSTFGDGLYTESLRYSYLLHLSVAILIILGSIGYPTLHDIFGIRSIRNRLQYPWKKLTINSRISLYTGFALIMLGMILFYILEKQNTLQGMKAGPAMIAALFQSVTTRSAGFNTVDISAITGPVLILFCFLMFIGGGSGSLGGGIRTSTFAVMCISAWNAIRGKNAMNIGHHQVSADVYYRVIAIFLYSASFVLGTTFLLTITEPNTDFADLIFEDISAFGTVGLSTGVTAGLSVAGKYIIIATMFVGRISTITLVVALSMRAEKREFKYPVARIMVG